MAPRHRRRVALLAGLPSAEIARRMEQKSNVRTPWRMGYALVLLVTLSFILAHI